MRRLVGAAVMGFALATVLSRYLNRNKPPDSVPEAWVRECRRRGVL